MRKNVASVMMLITGWVLIALVVTIAIIFWTKGDLGIFAIGGKDGLDGKSAYQIAVDKGYQGSEEEWIASLVGANGADGVGIVNVYVDETLHLWVELSNGNKIDAGYVGVATSTPTPSPSPSPTPDYNNPTLVVGTATAKAGDIIEITVNIKNNPGIAGAKLIVSYDDKLTLISAESGAAFKVLDYTEPASLASPSPFNWDSLNAQAANDGTILTLKFEVGNNVTVGEELNVVVSYTQGDIYNVNLDDVTLELVAGKITIEQ